MSISQSIVDAKKLLRESRYGALATSNADGSPYASLVSLATTMDGSPITLISGLALHTQNLARDNRASLLLASVGGGDPLVSPRISISVRVEISEEPSVRRRFLARNPDAAMYADFPDFSFRKLTMLGAHLVAGFGRIVDLSAADLTTDLSGAEDLVATEESAVAHMNEDHADALALYATRLLGQQPGAWRMTGVDPEGMDLLLGDEIARLPFPEPVRSGRELVSRLRQLGDTARSG